MIIDGHAHSCGDFFTAQGIVSTLDKLGVDKVVLCPGQMNDDKNQSLPHLASMLKNTDIMFLTNKIIRKVTQNRSTTNDLDKRNEYVYQLYRELPERIVQFYWADPNRESIRDELEQKYETMHFKGIKLHQCSEEFDSNSQQMNEIAEFARDKKIPVFIHLYSNKDVVDMMDLIRNHSHTTFIIAHLIGVEVFGMAEKNFANTYFEISPPSLISDNRTRYALNKFGSDHIILGSDTPYGKNNLERNIQRVERLKISDREKEQILGVNMQRILHI